jgi:hypothetical protein
VIGPVVFTLQVNGEPSDDEIIKIRTKVAKTAGKGAARVGTSKHVNMSSEESDPISALEALASSADQTAIHPEDDRSPLRKTGRPLGRRSAVAEANNKFDVTVRMMLT